VARPWKAGSWNSRGVLIRTCFLAGVASAVHSGLYNPLSTQYSSLITGLSGCNRSARPGADIEAVGPGRLTQRRHQLLVLIHVSRVGQVRMQRVAHVRGRVEEPVVPAVRLSAIAQTRLAFPPRLPASSPTRSQLWSPIKGSDQDKKFPPAALPASLVLLRLNLSPRPEATVCAWAVSSCCFVQSPIWLEAVPRGDALGGAALVRCADPEKPQYRIVSSG
jgi:hypothetical protein